MHHIISQVHRERVGNYKSAVLFCRLKFTYFALFTSTVKISEPVILVLMYSKRYSSTIHSVSYHFVLDHAEKNVYFFYHKTTILSEYKKEAREHASEFCFFRVTRAGTKRETSWEVAVQLARTSFTAQTCSALPSRCTKTSDGAGGAALGFLF